MKKIIALIISVLTVFTVIPFSSFALSSVTFEMTSSIPTSQKVALGDTVTYTVAIKANSGGFVAGTIFFKASSSLAYVSATYRGGSYEAKPDLTNEDKGYGISFVGDSQTDTISSFCSITFKVVNDGNISVTAASYQLTDGTNYITPTFTSASIIHEGTPLTKPNVLSITLEEAVMNHSYSFQLKGDNQDYLKWQITDGALPQGLTLSDSGLISGTPTEFGPFNITVKATLLGKLDSDTKDFTLTVLERPKTLELLPSSSLSIDTNKYLIGLKEKQNLTALLSNFNNTSNIKVFDAKGNEVTATDKYIGTAFTVCLMQGETKVDTVTVVVKGDVSGNGQVDVGDYLKVRGALFGNITLEGAELISAKVSEKQTVNVGDYLKIRGHLFKNLNLYE